MPPRSRAASDRAIFSRAACPQRLRPPLDRGSIGSPRVPRPIGPAGGRSASAAAAPSGWPNRPATPLPSFCRSSSSTCCRVTYLPSYITMPRDAITSSRVIHWPSFRRKPSSARACSWFGSSSRIRVRCFCAASRSLCSRHHSASFQWASTVSADVRASSAYSASASEVESTRATCERGIASVPPAASSMTTFAFVPSVESTSRPSTRPPLASSSTSPRTLPPASTRLLIVWLGRDQSRGCTSVRGSHTLNGYPKRSADRSHANSYLLLYRMNPALLFPPLRIFPEP